MDEADNAEVATVRAIVAAMPGAVGEPLARFKRVTLYKVCGKMFAILTGGPGGNVILKCDPYRAQMLREAYAGVGHRSHLDPRFWIAVDFGSDVPEEEITDLARHSYDLVRAGLTRKQRDGLAALA